MTIYGWTCPPGQCTSTRWRRASGQAGKLATACLSQQDHAAWPRRPPAGSRTSCYCAGWCWGWQTCSRGTDSHSHPPSQSLHTHTHTRLLVTRARGWEWLIDREANHIFQQSQYQSLCDLEMWIKVIAVRVKARSLWATWIQTILIWIK